MTPVRAVLFDLDGTLLDTAPDLVGALNHVRSIEGYEALPVDEYGRFASEGAVGLIRAGLPNEGPEREEQRRQQFLSHYAEHLLVDTRPFDGVDRLLDWLEARAVPWAVVTNKPEFLTLPLLGQLGWLKRATCVISGDTLPQRKPDAAPVLMACELSGVEPAAAMMVGDDPRDLEAGRAAGAQPVLAAYGYGADACIEQGWGAGPLIDTPAMLVELLESRSGAVLP